MWSMQLMHWPKLLTTCANHWNKATTKACFRFSKRQLKRNGTEMLWEIDIHPANGEPDRAAERVVSAARELELADELQVATARGFLIQSDSLQQADIERL